MISQSPAAGSKAKKGARVNIVVSAGPGELVAEQRRRAERRQGRGEAAQGGPEDDDQARAVRDGRGGSRDRHRTAAGTEVQVGSAVTLLVSSGPAPVRVPDVIGQTLEAAEATLTNAGLTRRHRHKRSLRHAVARHRARAVARRRRLAPAGSKVDLTVAQAPKEVAVPSVVGAARPQPAAALGDAGFKVATQPQPTTEQSQVGMVLEQSPAGGSARARARR